MIGVVRHEVGTTDGQLMIARDPVDKASALISRSSALKALEHRHGLLSAFSLGDFLLVFCH
jgi:hypothetical protein